MLRTSGFESDVFLSYAHIDDQALTEGQKGWISTFHHALEVRLAQLLGKPPRIFRDPKLQGNDYFADELCEKLPQTALLVSVVSPRYVKSDWCRREVEEFCRASEKTGGVRIANKARVFKVVKTPVPLAEHPSELQELLGYDFFVVEPETGRPRELSQLADPEIQRHYWTRLDDLAHDISDLLSILDKQDAAGEAPDRPSRGTIYLAEASFDLKEQRDSIKRDLQEHGWTVLPDRPLPLYGPECEALVREQLGRSSLSIHLVGQNFGVVPEGQTESVVVLQHELAIERGAAGGFSRLVWIPPGLETRDERQQRFLQRLQTDSRLQHGADLLETPLEDFKVALRRRLEPPAAEPAQSVEGSGHTRIYLICDQRDPDQTAALEDHLFGLGHEVILPVFEGDEAMVRRDHEESLALCDAVLIYYGAGSELWLRQKLREVQKSAAFRTRPIQARAVFVAAPDSPQKRRFRTHEALVIEQIDRFSPADLAPFFKQLKSHVGVLA